MLLQSTLWEPRVLSLKGLFYEPACTRRDGDTLVAFAHGPSVSLQRLKSLGHKPFANVSTTNWSHLLFRRNQLLLTSEWNSVKKTDIIMSLRVSDHALIDQRVLLDAESRVLVRAWTHAGDRLVLWDGNSKDLIVYAFAWVISSRTPQKNPALRKAQRIFLKWLHLRKRGKCIEHHVRIFRNGRLFSLSE